MQTGSDRDLVMTNLRLRLKKIVKPMQTRKKFDLEKLKDSKITEAFQTMIGGKCAPLTILEEKHQYRDPDQQLQQCSD